MGDYIKLTPEQFSAADVTGDWHIADGQATARFVTGGFSAGAELISQIARIADAANHHPDVDLRYGSVTVRLFTHDAGSLTELDVGMAQQISRLAADLGFQASS